jgi:hypothetical protein
MSLSYSHFEMRVLQSDPVIDCHSFIHQRLYSPLLGSGLLFTFAILFTQTVGPLGRGISPSHGLYRHTEQHKRRINSQTSMPWVGFETMIPAFQRAKTLTRRPPFTPQEDSWYSFLLEAESTPWPYCGWKD